MALKKFTPDSLITDGDFMEILKHFVSHKLHYNSIAEIFSSFSPTSYRLDNSEHGSFYTDVYHYIEDNMPHLINDMPFTAEVYRDPADIDGYIRVVTFVPHWDADQVRYHLCELALEFMGKWSVDAINEMAFGGEQCR